MAATTPPPLLFISPSEVELLRAAFDYQRTLVEARLERLIAHELEARQLVDSPNTRDRIVQSDADCRFQKRIMALDAQLLEQITDAIYQPEGVTLGRIDFYHLIRVVVAAGEPLPADMRHLGDKLRTLDPLLQSDNDVSVTLNLKDPLRTAPLNPLQYSALF